MSVRLVGDVGDVTCVSQVEKRTHTQPSHTLDMLHFSEWGCFQCSCDVVLTRVAGCVSYKTGGPACFIRHDIESYLQTNVCEPEAFIY